MPSIPDLEGPGLPPVSSPAIAAPSLRAGLLALAILGTLNLLDYMDRNILAAVLPQVRSSLKLSNEQAGNLYSAFLLSFSVVMPIVGWAADRVKRTWLLAAGVGVWGLATFGSGLATDYEHLWYARCLLGVGEATYGVIAPTLLMDLFPRRARARVLSAFYLAMPLGSALGMAVGGTIATRTPAQISSMLARWVGPATAESLSRFEGWHFAFFLVGIPALVAVVAAFFLPDPPRGASEGLTPEQLRDFQAARPSAADYRDLLVNSSYNYSVLALTAYTFAIGGLVAWFPYFLTRTRGIPQERASVVLGAVTFAAAVLGMSAGGWLSDRLGRKDPRALFLVPGLAMMGAVPFLGLGLFSESEPLIFASVFCAEALMFVNTGPLNAIIGHVVLPNMRATALGIAIACCHFLGDIWSPKLIGLIADRFGRELAMQSAIGRALAALGATPTRLDPNLPPENILAGLLIVVPAVLLAGLVMISGVRHLPREMYLMQARLRAARGDG